MTKVYAPHLVIIREALSAINQYRPTSKTVFLANPMVRDAVLMRLQVIGEHLSRMRHIDEERFAEIADPTWFQVIGLRNVISHGYETIDPERIWHIISAELPALEQSRAVFDQ